MTGWHTRFLQMTFGNGVVAIVAGVLASFASNFGVVAPFDLSLVCLIAGTAIIYTTWKENYGDKNSAPALVEANVKSFNRIRRLPC